MLMRRGFSLFSGFLLGGFCLFPFVALTTEIQVNILLIQASTWQPQKDSWKEPRRKEK
jgi:hypothetical protein